MTKKYIHFYLILTLLFSACSNLKYLPEGELLYVGGKVDIEGEKISRREKKQLEENLEDLLRPRPNSKFLGLRPKLYFYNIAGKPKKEKGFKYWLKNKVGQPPVLFSQVNMEYNENLLQNFVENKGFFNAKTSSDSTTRNKKVTAEYSITLNNRYFIKEVSFPKDSSQITAAVTSTRENSFLNPGKPYDLDVIKAEKFKDLTIIDPGKKFKPQIFARSLQFEKGEPYNRTDHNKSLNRLVNLGTFKFVKNQFKESDSIENGLDAYYFLTPLPKKSIRLELLGKTNSANYAGSEINLNWSNRNTFKGAELLTISAFGGFEVQVSGLHKGFNVYRLGTEAALIWPKLLTPFKLESSSAFVPRTKASLGYEFQTRSKLYSLNSFKTSFGYLWKENIRTEHQLNILNINYVNPLKVTQLYEDQIALNPTLGKVIEKQLIFGPTYTFTFTNTMKTEKTSTFYYQGGIDLAGNIAGLLTGANINSGPPETIFG